MKRKLRVLLDVDGPLTTGYIDKYVDYVNQYSDREPPVKTSDITHYNIKQALDFLHPEAFDYADQKMRLKGVAYSFKVMLGAIDFVSRVRTFADVYAVTAPLQKAPYWQYDRQRWLEDMFGFQHDEIIATHAKHVCDGDVLIEDKPQTLLAWHAEHSRETPVLWRTSYNVDHWNQFLSVDNYDVLLKSLKEIV